MTIFVENVPPEHFQGIDISSLEQGEAVLFASPQKCCRIFSPLSPRAKRMAQGVSPSADGDKGASRPLDPPTAFFEKKAAQKNFYTF